MVFKVYWIYGFLRFRVSQAFRFCIQGFRLGLSVQGLGFPMVQGFMLRVLFRFLGISSMDFLCLGFLGFYRFRILGLHFFVFLGFNRYNLGLNRVQGLDFFQVYGFLRVKCLVGFRVLNLGFLCSFQVQGLRIFRIQCLDCDVLYGF